MSERHFSGGCGCGAVRFQVIGPGRWLCYCHCVSCRRFAGAPLLAWGTFARSGFTLLRGELREYPSSPGVLRGFCPTCGGCLTYRREAGAGEIDVTLASLDDAGSLAPQMHVWTAEKLPWVRLEDGLPQYPGRYSEPGA